MTAPLPRRAPRGAPAPGVLLPCCRAWIAEQIHYQATMAQSQPGPVAPDAEPAHDQPHRAGRDDRHGHEPAG